MSPVPGALATGSVVGAASAGLVDATTLEWTQTALLGILSYGLLAGVVAATVAFGYRAGTVRNLDLGPTMLVGLAAPAAWLTLELGRTGTIVADSPAAHHSTATYVLGVVAAGTALAATGHRLGDRIACGVFDIDRLETDGAVADRIRSAGLAVAITLPATVDDVATYPAVDAELKRRLEGRTLLVPRRLSRSERRNRLRRRLEADFDVGYVDLELDADGGVESLAVGRRRPGIGPTLPPDTVAVAIESDPVPGASVGDPVAVWTREATATDSSRLVATGTVRASSGSVTTLVVDAADAAAFAPGDRYRLTVRSASASDAGELVSAIRAADATVTTVTVESDGPLEGEFVGWVPGTVVAIDREEAAVGLPAERNSLRAGDTAYVVGDPASLTAVDGGVPADSKSTDGA